MHKTSLHRAGKFTFFRGINTKQFSIGIWVDKNCASLDLGIVWFSLAWN